MLEKLKLQIARYRRDKFGASSERLAQLGQLELLVEELETGRAQMEVTTDAAVDPVASDSLPTHRKPVRKPLPEHLPRKTVTHQVACSCAGCGGALRFISEDIAAVLEIVPEQFKVIRHVRPKFSCVKCQSITRAPETSGLWQLRHQSRPKLYRCSRKRIRVFTTGRSALRVVSCKRGAKSARMCAKTESTDVHEMPSADSR
jgi:hypothetical protein